MLFQRRMTVSAALDRFQTGPTVAKSGEQATRTIGLKERDKITLRTDHTVLSECAQSRCRVAISRQAEAGALLFESLFDDDAFDLLSLGEELVDDELSDDDEPLSDLLLDDADSELDEPERESVR